MKVKNLPKEKRPKKDPVFTGEDLRAWKKIDDDQRAGENVIHAAFRRFYEIWGIKVGK